jgi:hypothetical protein
LLDLVVTIVMAVLVLGYLAPIPAKSRESSSRVKCASNLRTIGQAMFMYSNEDVRTGSFPRTRYEAGEAPTSWTSPFAAQPFGSGGPELNDVTAGLYLLLRTQDITPDIFICPSRGGSPVSKNWTSRSNFEDQNELSYSYQNPYPTVAARDAGFVFNNSLTSDFAVMADLNPGGDALLTITPQSRSTDLRKGNSPNHDYDGQQVLYADGHVDWSSSPFVGCERDNIYTFGSVVNKVPQSLGIVGSPVDGKDSVLLPVWDSSIPMPAPKPTPLASPAVAIGLVILGVIVLAMIYFGIKAMRVARTPPPPPMQPPL